MSLSKERNFINSKFKDQYNSLDEFWSKLVAERNITETRARMNVIYRHAFSSICYDISTLPLVQIADIINRDHATVVHSVRINTSKRKHDSEYESVYIWMHNQISSVLKEHITERTEAIFSRVRKTNPDIDVDSLVESINREWAINTRATKEENKKLKKENKSISKKAEMLLSRNKILESELKRVKEQVKSHGIFI